MATRVRQLPGPKPVGDVHRRLGDSSHPRAHKILNPERVRGVGQAITLALGR